MDWNLFSNPTYWRLSGLMFLEFAVWGAWMPVLAIRLLGPLKMTGKQTGWIYATFPLACIFAPLVSGYLADCCFNAEWIILVCHAAGAVLLFLAARQTKFWGMFWVMLIYCVFFTATLPLVNKLLFRHLADHTTPVFFWAPVAWALIGLMLTAMRQMFKLSGHGPDSLYLAAALSVLMAVMSFFQLPTEPKTTVNPMLEALGMLRNYNYLLFIVVQLAVSGMMQFYFLGTGQFMQDRGISGRNISGAMGLAQAVQAAATILVLDLLLKHGGYQWTFVIGALSWSALYLTYIATKQPVWIVASQAFHGLAYVFFMIGGQIFVGAMAPSEINASAQSLIFIATTGIGLFLGTQLAGIVMDRNAVEGKFQWSKIWAVPLAITLAGAIVFAVAFKVPQPSDFQKERLHKAQMVVHR
jgi:MFS family permease